MIKLISDIVRDLSRETKTPMFRRSPIRHLLYRLAWHLRPYFQNAGSHPLAVDIEFKSACNFKCVFCQQSTYEKHTKDWSNIDWGLLKRSVDELVEAGVYSAKVNWRGESTLDPEVAEKIKYMKDAGLHEVIMNTNASKLTPELSVKLVEAGLDRIIFSCDGLSKETYDMLRRGGKFEVFERNVREFRRIRDNLGSKTPVIRINAAIMAQNKHEIPHFREFFRDIAEEFRFNTVYQPTGANGGLNDGAHRTTHHKGCTQIYQRMIIDLNGDVVNCCANWQKRAPAGNILREGLLDLWGRKSEGLRYTHEKHMARKLDMCKDCDLFSLSERNDSGKVIWN